MKLPKLNWKVIIIVVIVILLILYFSSRAKANSRKQTTPTIPVSGGGGGGSTATIPPAGSNAGFPIKVGSKGNDVKTLQHYINVTCLIPHNLTPIAEDGNYGPQTGAAADQCAQLNNIVGHTSGQVNYSEFKMLENLALAQGMWGGTTTTTGAGAGSGSSKPTEIVLDDYLSWLNPFSWFS